MNEQGAAGNINCSCRWVCIYFSNPTAYPTGLKGLDHEMNEQGSAGNIHCSSRWVWVYFSNPTAYPTELKGLDKEKIEQRAAGNIHTLLQPLGLRIFVKSHRISYRIEGTRSRDE
jgi:hypothetical protein